MSELSDAVLKYKEITVQIYTSLEIDNLDNLLILFNKRKEIIEQINTMEYTNEEFTNIYNETGTGEIDKRIIELMNEKRADLKLKINKVSSGLNANKSYYKKYNVDPMFFNKKL